jgi:Carbohydrate binding domain
MKTRSGTTLFLLGLSLVCFALSASAIPIGNIVNNGGFENGGLSPWKTSGNTGGGAFRTNAENNGAFGVDQDSAHTGSFGAFAAPHGSLGYLSQTLQTQPGSVYELSFWLSTSQSDAFSAASAGQPLDFQIFLNGSMIFEQTSAFPTSYSHYDFALQPNLHAPSTSLKFGFRNDSGEFHIDDIIVGINSVPEAFSSLWLALPLLLLLVAARFAGKKTLDPHCSSEG